ncbi:MAG: ATP-dependent zinc protease [Bacteroidota bacterium]
MDMTAQKQIIGKDDIADLPAFELENVKVKTDSGAYTSTIHCSHIDETGDGLEVIFLAEDEQGFTGKKMTIPVYQRKKVRSSSGEQQERYIIQGNIVLFGETYNTEFTLSRRDLMRYPVLLGRKLLNHRFLVDTAASNTSYNMKNNINA